MERIRVEWAGLSGLPGVSTFYAVPTVPTAYAAVHAFFEQVRYFLPSSLTLSFPSSGDLIEDSTGAIVGTWSTTGLPALSGSGATTNHAAGVGAYVNWNTAGVSPGNRRIKGRTFITGLSTTYFDASGTIENTARATIETEANDMVAAADFRIWSRPSAAGAGDGASWIVNSATVPDRVTSLRSRRW